MQDYQSYFSMNKTKLSLSLTHTSFLKIMLIVGLEMKIYIGMPNFYLPDIKTASYCPRLAAFTRCFNLLRDGRTSNAGGSAKKHIFDQSLLKRKLQLEHLKRNTTRKPSHT